VEDGQRPQAWENLDELIAIAERDVLEGSAHG
jgi:hypothetical protein